MTPSAVGMVFAVVVLIAGLAYFRRKEAHRARAAGLVATIVTAGVVGWFAWLAGTQTSSPRVECLGQDGCDHAAAAAVDLLRDQKGEMPEYLRVDGADETWFVIACWPEGRYITVKVALESTPPATLGGALYGVVNGEHCGVGPSLTPRQSTFSHPRE